MPGMSSALKSLTNALNKFGHGDRINAPRVLKLVEPAGLSLAVSTGLGERSDCVEALFKLLGSDAFRKDEEIGLVIGEALALFAEAYSSSEEDLSTSIENWPLDMNDTFARSLSPPAQVSVTLNKLLKQNGFDELDSYLCNILRLSTPYFEQRNPLPTTTKDEHVPQLCWLLWLEQSDLNLIHVFASAYSRLCMRFRTVFSTFLLTPRATNFLEKAVV